VYFFKQLLLNAKTLDGLVMAKNETAKGQVTLAEANIKSLKEDLATFK
jgi:hypothetical protein